PHLSDGVATAASLGQRHRRHQQHVHDRRDGLQSAGAARRPVRSGLRLGAFGGVVHDLRDPAQRPRSKRRRVRSRRSPGVAKIPRRPQPPPRRRPLRHGGRLRPIHQRRHSARTVSGAGDDQCGGSGELALTERLPQVRRTAKKSKIQIKIRKRIKRKIRSKSRKKSGCDLSPTLNLTPALNPLPNLNLNLTLTLLGELDPYFARSRIIVSLCVTIAPSSMYVTLA